MNMLICPPKSQFTSLTGTQTSVFCAEYHCAGMPAEMAAPAKTVALASRVSPTPGNFPILWATKIHMEMQRALTLCAFTESCNPELLLQRHLPPLPANIILT